MQPRNLEYLRADPTVSLSYAVRGGSNFTVVSSSRISPLNSGIPLLFVYFDEITGEYIFGSEIKKTKF